MRAHILGDKGWQIGHSYSFWVTTARYLFKSILSFDEVRCANEVINLDYFRVWKIVSYYAWLHKNCKNLLFKDCIERRLRVVSRNLYFTSDRDWILTDIVNVGCENFKKFVNYEMCG